MGGDIVDQGIELMLFGMGTVVVFLTLLIVATNLMSWCVTRFFPDPPASPALGISSGLGAAPPADRATHIAVITAALHQHRSRKNKTG